MTRRFGLLAITLTIAARCCAQQESLAAPVHIEVHYEQPDGILTPVWNYFGYDEPNYTYTANGRKLLKELSVLTAVPIYVRVHNLLTSGDGTASLKWGSTNAYTVDAAGKPAYSWIIVDRIFDTFRDAKIKPLVEIGFMPEALSTHPDPYRHHFPEGNIFTGWAYPPKDYTAWAELVFQFVRHLRERYGDAEVKTWLWEVWNEPDIAYWKGTPEEFLKLYDYSVDAVRRALPDAQVGGPDTTGPSYAKAAEFLRTFLEHCARGKNFVDGRTGARLDFISFHPKGAPKWLADHVQMGIARQLASIDEGFKIVASFPEWQKTPIVLGESDPEGCAACSAKTNPQNAYRNGALYPVYEAEAVSDTYALAAKEHVNLLGSVTWAFEFEDQPYFEGFRELATNGLDKPVLNAFRMLGMLGIERVRVSSSGAVPVEQILASGVRQQADVNAIATRREKEVEILVWNYHDDDVRVDDAAIDLQVSGLPPTANRVRLEQFRVDAAHSNSFEAWKAMGAPQTPTAEQYAKLEEAGHLQLLSAMPVKIESGSTRLAFRLPRESVSLFRLTW